MKYRYVIWVRNGKVGGTSLEYALAGMNGNMHWSGSGLITVEPRADRITELHSVRTSYLYGVEEFKQKWPGIWDRAFKFMLVRHPYDRFVSAWKFFEWTNTMSIERALKNKYSDAINFHLTRPQTEGLIKDGKLDIDHLLYFENFQEEVDKLCEILQINKVTLPHLRKSNRRAWQVYLKEDKTKDILREMFTNDFKYLGYG